jgi:GDP-L-fucose synthase
MPTNLYGPGDNYHPENAHVVPALIRRFDEARRQGAAEVVVWGTGKPLREFLFVDDLADALLLLMQQYSAEGIMNVGSGDEVSIGDLARMIAAVTGYNGSVRFDAGKPDGTPRKLLDSSRLKNLGWTRCTRLDSGLQSTVNEYVSSRKP